MEVYRYEREPCRPEYTLPERAKSHRIGLANGPSFLRDPNRTAAEDEEDEIPLNENDPEVRKNTVSLKTQTSKHHGLGADRFSRFSSLHSLQRAIANLIVFIKEFKRRKNKSQEEFESKISSSKNSKLMR